MKLHTTLKAGCAPRHFAAMLLLISSVANAQIATSISASGTTINGTSTAPAEVKIVSEDENAIVSADTKLTATYLSIFGSVNTGIMFKLNSCNLLQTCSEYSSGGSFSASVKDNIHLILFPGSIGIDSVVVTYTSFLGGTNPPTSTYSGVFCGGLICNNLALGAGGTVTISKPAGLVSLSAKVVGTAMSEYGAGNNFPTGAATAQFKIVSIDVYDKNGKKTSDFLYNSDSGTHYPISGIYLNTVASVR